METRPKSFNQVEYLEQMRLLNKSIRTSQLNNL
jgi:hypothetical protein